MLGVCSGRSSEREDPSLFFYTAGLGVTDPSLSPGLSFFSLWLSFRLLSAPLPLRSEKLTRFWTSTLLSTAFSQPPESPFSLSLLTFSSLHHTFQLSGSSLTPTLICPYFALLIYSAVLQYVQTARCLQCGFSRTFFRHSQLRARAL